MPLKPKKRLILKILTPRLSHEQRRNTDTIPTAGDWQEFALTAIYRDAEGYTRTDSYTAREIPADQAPAMQAVVAALVGLAEPWKASQVWARLEDFINFDRAP